MPNAFILEPCSQDIKKAAQFGQITYIFDHNQRRPSLWDHEFVVAAMKSLEQQNFNVKEDCIVVVGHYNPILIIISALVHAHKNVKVLMWSSTDRAYVLKTVGEDYR